MRPVADTKKIDFRVAQSPPANVHRSIMFKAGSHLGKILRIITDGRVDVQWMPGICCQGARQKLLLQTRHYSSTKAGGSLHSARSKINVSKRETLRSRTVEDMESAGEKYSETCGVESKYENEGTAIDWHVEIGWKDHEAVVNRCMSKYPEIVPGEISLNRADSLIRNLKGFRDLKHSNKADLLLILSQWSDAYRENI